MATEKELRSGRQVNPAGFFSWAVENLSSVQYDDLLFHSVLHQEEVTCHPFIIGELACGGIKNRHEILGLISDLPSTVLLDHGEIMEFIEYRKLMNRGIGYVDVHLLASALVSDTSLWTLDKALRKVASELSIAYQK